MIQIQLLSYCSLLVDKHDSPPTVTEKQGVPLSSSDTPQVKTNGIASTCSDPEFIDINDLKIEAKDQNTNGKKVKKSGTLSQLVKPTMDSAPSNELIDLCTSDESELENTIAHTSNLLSPRTYTRKSTDESSVGADFDNAPVIDDNSIPSLSSQPTSNKNKPKNVADVAVEESPPTQEVPASIVEDAQLSGDELLEGVQEETAAELVPDSILDSDTEIKSKSKRSKSKPSKSVVDTDGSVSETSSDHPSQQACRSPVNEVSKKPTEEQSDAVNETHVSQSESSAGLSADSHSEAEEGSHSVSAQLSTSSSRSPRRTGSRTKSLIKTLKKSKKTTKNKTSDTDKSALEKESQELEVNPERLRPQSPNDANESHKSSSRSHSPSLHDDKSDKVKTSDQETVQDSDKTNHIALDSDAEARAKIGDLMSDDDDDPPISQNRGSKMKKARKRRLLSSDSNSSSSSDSDSDFKSSMASKMRWKRKDSPRKRKENAALRKLREDRERKQKRANRRFRPRRGQLVKQMNRTERRYAMRRVRGLIVQLKEKKQTALQKLLTEIENKSRDEIDPEHKLQQQCSVGLTKYDLQDPEVIQSLLNSHASKSDKKSVSSLNPSDSESDPELRSLDKEIKKLSRFEIMINKEDNNQNEVGKQKRGRKIRSGSQSPPIKKSRKQISESELSDTESDDDLSDDVSSEKSSDSDDIITLPNKDQIDNERALQNILNDMSDSDDNKADYSDLESSDPGDIQSDSSSSVVPDRRKLKNKVKLKKRHKLEGKAIDSDDSQASSFETSEDDGMRDEDSTDSESSDFGPRRKNSDSDSVPKALASRRKRKKRSRVKSSSDSSKSDSDIQEVSEPSPGKKEGRKSIRHIIKDSHLEKDTRQATRAETERRKRVEQKRKEYEAIMSDPSSPIKRLQTQKELVLERDSKGEPVIEVDQTLITKLKPHQLSAVQFLWDCCCETIKRTNETAGGGAILAHCMGLGKTLSLITFIHTVLSYEDKLHLKKVLVICPLGTVLNWNSEIKHWTKHLDIRFKVYEMSSVKKPVDRLARLRQWTNSGGICVIGYDLYSLLSRGARMKDQKMKEKFKEYLQNPGADFVVADEGHILKSNKSQLRNAVCGIKTLRRIVLTGTPLQNRLDEYYYMMDFVKPRLLGSNNEFKNRFINPISNGSMKDSTPQDVRLMKKRAHVLHELLAGCVQRQDYTCLDKYLPPKHEYILKIPLSDLQIKLYRKYLELIGADKEDVGRHGTLFADFQSLGRIWNHPMLLKTHMKRQDDEDSFLDDRSTSSSEDPNSDDILELNSGSENSGDKTWKPVNRKQKTTEKTAKDEPNKDEKADNLGRTKSGSLPLDWWKDVVKGEDLNQIENSPKFSLLMRVLQDAYAVGDKVLLFSQSILNLDLIEDFLEQIDIESQGKGGDPRFRHKTGELGGWQKGKHYFRIDGSVEGKKRTKATKIFNTDNNYDARLFLISTRAGGVGINIVGANRVIIFDASWNPSNDLQAIFRAYRFGQNKPVYVYRFIAQGTMEEKIYNRQISKLSLSERVVDERQIERHYTSRNLQELYSFEPQVPGSQATPILPQDQLLADILSSTNQQLILSIQEHDSLLQHQMDENLTEEERQAAWREYNEEKERGETAASRSTSLLANQRAETLGAIPPVPDITLIYKQMKARYPNTVDSVLATMAREKFKHEQNRRILALNQLQIENQRLVPKGQPQSSIAMTQDMLQRQQIYQQRQQAYEEQYRQQRMHQQRQQQARYQQQMGHRPDAVNYPAYNRQQPAYQQLHPKPTTSSANVMTSLLGNQMSTANQQAHQSFQTRQLGQLSAKQQELIARQNK